MMHGTEAYKTGRAAGEQYCIDDDAYSRLNPYPKNSENWQAWNLGWNDAIQNWLANQS